MYTVALFGKRVMQSYYCFCGISRSLCNRTTNVDLVDHGFGCTEEHLNVNWKSSDFVYGLDEEPISHESFGSRGASGNYESYSRPNFSGRRSFFEQARYDSERALEILNQDGPEFDAKEALDDMQIRISGLFVREVLLGILTNINYANKKQYAKLGYKFFIWSGQQENYSHTVNSYHLMMKIFADSEEFKAMMRLVDEMIEKGFPTTSRFVVAGELERAQDLFTEMIAKGQVPNVFTYNSMIRGLCMAGRFKDACLMLEEMESKGCNPNFLVYNTLVSYLRNAGKLSQAHEIIRIMTEKGKYIHLISKFKRYRRCGHD